MRIGFTVISRTTEVEFKVVAPRNNDRTALVAFSQVGDYSAALVGRLYYRDELLSNLIRRLPHGFLQECKADDATLALALYRACGIAALERLEGDFALVIWDAARACLIGIRDPLGGYPLFWATCDATIALSTSLRPLLEIVPSKALNLDFLADFLMMPGQRNEGPGELCAYEGMHRILPGTILSFHVPTMRVERRAYWNWLAQLKDPGTDRMAEVAGQYADLLRAAVRERIQGRTLAHLSGGMDSTAVALIARDLIGSGVGEAPLHTLSLVYEKLPGLARERPYLESVLQHEKEIVAHRLAADELLDFDSFTDPPLHEEPYAGLWRLGMDRETVEVAAKVGAVTMLTGLGSDDLLDVQPFYLADLLRQGRLLQAWQEAAIWARARNCSPWSILHPFGIVPLASAWLPGGMARIWTQRRHMRLSAQHDWAIPPWILPDFARRHTLHSRAIENAQHIYRLCQHTGMSVALNAIANMAGDVIRWSVAAPQGVIIAHPFLDGRLLCLGLGIQSRIQPKPGKMKPILAEAMRGILPDNIRNRRRKGHFNEVYYLGLARNVRNLESMIQQAPIDDLEIIDKDILIQCLQEASMASVNARRLQRLDFALSLIKWLCMQHEWQRTQDQATDVIKVRRQDNAVKVDYTP